MGVLSVGSEARPPPTAYVTFAVGTGVEDSDGAVVAEVVGIRSVGASRLGSHDDDHDKAPKGSTNREHFTSDSGLPTKSDAETALHGYGPSMEGNASSLASWSGRFALVGAAMWTYKSVAILATGEQPDYWFELALPFFGVSILLLVKAIGAQIVRFPRLALVLAWLAAIGGAFAGTAYIVEGDDDLFGPAALVTVVSIVVTLFLIGAQARRSEPLPRYNFAPTLLAWLFVAALPLGAVLSGIDERLLEVALMGVVVGWVVLAAGAISSPAPSRP